MVKGGLVVGRVGFRSCDVFLSVFYSLFPLKLKLGPWINIVTPVTNKITTASSTMIASLAERDRLSV
jgi:hypothetical protein